MKKWWVIGALAILLGAFIALDYEQYLNLDYLKASQEQFGHWLARYPMLIPAAFFVLYVAVTGLSLPSATVLTVAAGAMFGFWPGLLLVSFASTIGATLAFVVARFLLRDTVQRHFGDRLKTINQGIERDGAFYLFTLRLVPLIPFFVINLTMGLTPMRTWTFYWVSQVGMLGATVVYVNAGTQLANVDALSDVLSPTLIFSLALLGIFPWLAKWLTSAMQRRRVYQKWRRPKSFDRNLIVIGAGAAGLVSAYIAAAVKAKVTLVEAHKMGGDCLNYGCIPSKALIKSARVANLIRHADRYGLEPQEPRLNFLRVMGRVREIIRKVEPHDSEERYTSLGVDVVRGHARIIDPWTVEIMMNDGAARRLTTQSIIIAAGSSPVIPSLPGLDEVNYVTSDTLWDTFSELQKPPARLVVLGGGPIGCELSQAFARLGSQVVLVEMAERILMNEDDDVAQLARQSLEQDGVQFFVGHQAIRCKKDGERNELILENSGQKKTIEFDFLLCAIGRKARLTDYGLEKLEIDTERTVITNEYLETLYPNIYAAGDVASPYQFTHVASHMAWYATVNALFGQVRRFKADYSLIPRVTFIEPEIAKVGLSEHDAREQGISYEVISFAMADLDRAIAESTTQGFIKVLTKPRRDKIIGVTIVGAQAGELLAEFVLAMRSGLGLNRILGTIHCYPTLVEANKYVAGEWKKAHAPKRVLRWLERYHGWRRGSKRS